MKNRRVLFMFLTMIAIVLPLLINLHKNDTLDNEEESDQQTYNKRSHYDKLVNNTINYKSGQHLLSKNEFNKLRNELLSQLPTQQHYQLRVKEVGALEIIPKIGEVIGVFEEIYYKQPQLKREVLNTFKSCGENPQNSKVVTQLCLASFSHLTNKNESLSTQVLATN